MNFASARSPLKVVIASPAYYTGGPEALHQLDHALRQLGVDSQVVYHGPRNTAVEADFGKRYGTRVFTGAPDAQALLVIPELEDPLAWRSAGWRRIAVWWLAAPRQLPLANYDGCYHLFQSAHARDRRAAEGVAGSLVSDYLREDLFPSLAEHGSPVAGEKRDLIAFNHRSAAWIASLGVTEIPAGPLRLLAGLPPERISELLRRTRYFVDVGWHPGRDRMLREAAMHGARVLVGRQGAAACAEDVPLPDCARIDDEAPGSLAKRIAALEADPAPIEQAMLGYRAWIRAQKETFLKEVAAWIESPSGPWLAERPPELVLPPHDPAPLLERDLARSRMLLSAVGSRLIRHRQSRLPSGLFARLELAAARLLKSRRAHR